MEPGPRCGNAFFAMPVYSKTRTFAKTGSGQTHGKIGKKRHTRMPAGVEARSAVRSQHGQGEHSAGSWRLQTPMGCNAGAKHSLSLLRCHFILKRIVLPRQARDKHCKRRAENQPIAAFTMQVHGPRIVVAESSMVRKPTEPV